MVLEYVLWTDKIPFLKTQLLELAGLTKVGDADPNELLYMREEARELWDFLSKRDTRKKLGLIRGPPGSGKSRVVWSWLCYQSYAYQKNVVWLHLDQSGGVALTSINCEGYANTYLVTEIGSSNFRSFLEEHPELDIVVVDGITKEGYTSFAQCLLLWCKGKSERQVLIVTSAHVTIAAEQLQSSGTIIFDMSSWNIDQYRRACTNADFLARIASFLGEGFDTDEQISNKHTLAGGCIRWMFGMDAKSAKNDIDAHLLNVSNFEELLQGSSGGRESTAINHLQCWYPDANGKFKPFIVSQYVLRQLSGKCSLQSVTSCYRNSMVACNPALLGWVFELDFLAQLHHLNASHQNMELCNILNESVTWRVPKVVRFNSDDYKTIPSAGTYWLIPEKWDQAGYDAVYFEDNLARMVQVTTTVHRRNLKLEYFASLLNTLAENNHRYFENVEVVVVFPNGTEEITLGSVTGDLRHWGTSLDPSDFVKFLKLKKSD